MNNRQRTIIIVALLTAGLLLPCQMLQWGDGWSNSSLILALYDHATPGFPGLTSTFGIYTSYGATGIMTGIVAPLLMLAEAAVLLLGKSEHSHQTPALRTSLFI